jgi:hypothetical protein
MNDSPSFHLFTLGAGQSGLSLYTTQRDAAELEIWPGVLYDSGAAGLAFFYFRDRAWSDGQSEPGFLCDSTDEETKLITLEPLCHRFGSRDQLSVS